MPRTMVLVISMMVLGCYPMTGGHIGLAPPSSDTAAGEQTPQEMSTVGLVPLAGHVIYWWRTIPDDGAHAVEPWTRAIVTPVLAVVLPASIVGINALFLGSPTVAYLVHGCGERGGPWGGSMTLAGRCTTGGASVEGEPAATPE